MVVKEVFPEDIQVVVQFRASELEMIKLAMDHCELTYFGPDKEQMDAQQFFRDRFYPFLAELVKTLKDE